MDSSVYYVLCFLGILWDFQKYREEGAGVSKSDIQKMLQKYKYRSYKFHIIFQYVQFHTNDLLTNSLSGPMNLIFEVRQFSFVIIQETDLVLEGGFTARWFPEEIIPEKMDNVPLALYNSTTLRL